MLLHRMKIHVQRKGHNSYISWSITLNTATQTHTQVMLQDDDGSENVECASWEMSEVILSAQALSREVCMQYSHKTHRRRNNPLCSYSFWILFLSLVCDHRLFEGTAHILV